ncbi:ribonuclease H-like YkuK family protein [Patescibacteria group bacterium]
MSQTTFSHIISPTFGRLSFPAMYDRIQAYIQGTPAEDVRFLIGTDSKPAHRRNEKISYYTVLVVWCVGGGARYFYVQSKGIRTPSFKQRVWNEATLSLAFAQKVQDEFTSHLSSQPRITVEVDAGLNGQTRDIINQVVGMITGSGFDSNHKPNTVACRVADACTNGITFRQAHLATS